MRRVPPVDIVTGGIDGLDPCCDVRRVQPARDENAQRSATAASSSTSSQLLRPAAARVALERPPADLRLIRQPVLLPPLPERQHRLLDRRLVVRIGDDARIPLPHQSAREIVRTCKAQERTARRQVLEQLPGRREARARHVEQSAVAAHISVDRPRVLDVAGVSTRIPAGGSKLSSQSEPTSRTSTRSPSISPRATSAASARSAGVGSRMP